MSNKISIITISYNSEASIERTIKSVLSQSFLNYEYIVVDGGSTDHTLDIIKKYEPKFEGRMKWVSEPDKGIYNAMNKGVLRSEGDIIGIVNSDDWLEEETLQKIINVTNTIKDVRNCIICGSLRFHYENGIKQVFQSNQKRFEEGMKKHSFNHGAYHPSMFVGKNVYHTVGLFDENFKIAADIDFVVRCYQAGIKFYFTKEVLNNMSDGGASNTLNFKKVIADKKYDYQKRGISPIKTYWDIYLLCIKMIVKRFTPLSLILKYRNK